MRRRALAALLLPVAALCAQNPAVPAVPAVQAIHHVGELATVCGPIASEHPAASIPGLPTFIDLGQELPRPSFTVILWQSDRKNVGDFPTTGSVCVTGRISEYKGVPQVVLTDAAGWSKAPATDSDPPTGPALAASRAAPAPAPTPAPKPALAPKSNMNPEPPVAAKSAHAASIAAASPPAASPPAAAPSAATSPATPEAAAAKLVTNTTPVSPAQPDSTPVASSPAADAVVPSFVSPSYRIGAADSLQITVWKEPTLSGTFLVRPDGKVSLVLVGDVRATGLTPMELAGNLTERFRKFIQDPLVSVIVLEPNSQRIYVLGEVQRAGPIAMATAMSPLQAIATAGGLTPYADQKKIYILRGPEGQQRKIPFNYKNALNAKSSSSVRLQAGDTIVVP